MCVFGECVFGVCVSVCVAHQLTDPQGVLVCMCMLISAGCACVYVNALNPGSVCVCVRKHMDLEGVCVCVCVSQCTDKRMNTYSIIFFVHQVLLMLMENLRPNRPNIALLGVIDRHKLCH